MVIGDTRMPQAQRCDGLGTLDAGRTKSCSPGESVGPVCNSIPETHLENEFFQGLLPLSSSTSQTSTVASTPRDHGRHGPTFSPVSSVMGKGANNHFPTAKLPGSGDGGLQEEIKTEEEIWSGTSHSRDTLSLHLKGCRGGVSSGTLMHSATGGWTGAFTWHAKPSTLSHRQPRDAFWTLLLWGCTQVRGLCLRNADGLKNGFSLQERTPPPATRAPALPEIHKNHGSFADVEAKPAGRMVMMISYMIRWRVWPDLDSSRA